MSLPGLPGAQLWGGGSRCAKLLGRPAIFCFPPIILFVYCLFIAAYSLLCVTTFEELRKLKQGGSA